jgi:hypothetical protein
MADALPNFMDKYNQTFSVEKPEGQRTAEDTYKDLTTDPQDTQGKNILNIARKLYSKQNPQAQVYNQD